MNERQAKQRIEKLKNLINDYRYHYHVLDESTMSEAAADSLKHELSELESQFPHLITSDSPSQRVAGQVSEAFKSIAHSTRMLSLNDVFNQEELEAWYKRTQKVLHTEDTLELFADLKMDGLACALRYQDGQLILGLTRGDGMVGEDVTANVRTIDAIPLTLKNAPAGMVEVRGEIVMYKADFAALNKDREKLGLPLFANPRNTAAGTIRQLDPRLVAERKLRFHAYDISQYPEDLLTYKCIYDTLQAIGFKVNKSAAKFSQLTKLEDYINEWETKRAKLPFNTDGVVIKLNDRTLYRQAGIVGKAPRGAAAFKYPAEQSTTKVKDIFISIGRTGAATPVAILEPVLIAGSTVQMATLHNETEIARKDIRVGDTVIVQKAGDIIPEVVKPLEELRTGKEKPYTMPKVCPECSTPLHKQKEDEAVWRCPNLACPARVSNQIQHFASKSGLDIEGLGEKNVLALLDAKLINSSADIYRLTKDKVLSLERFAEKSADNLINAIAAKKKPPLHRFLYGLGIRHVGAQTAVDIANTFKTLEKIKVATYEEFESIEGIGVVVAESLVAWFADPTNQQLLDDFTRNGVSPEPVKETKTTGELAGKKVVVTGSLTGISREDAAEMIRRAGGTFQSSVGKDTDYLVAGKNVGASKLEKAQKTGTKVITEAEFKTLVKP